MGGLLSGCARHDPARHIAVSAEILGRAVDDARRVEAQRLDQARRGEGGVDDERDAVRLAHRGDGFDVGDALEGVGDHLNEQTFWAFGRDATFELREIEHVDEFNADAFVAQRRAKQRERAAVAVPGREHGLVRARSERAQCTVNRRHA